MIVIAVYDISDPKIQTRVRNILRRFLFHVQFSVFEGRIRESQFFQLITELENLEKDLSENDGIVLFRINIESKVDRYVIGSKGEEPSNIL